MCDVPDTPNLHNHLTPRTHGHTLAHMSTPLLTVNEAANRLEMSRRSLYRLIETDQIAYVRGLTPAAPVRFRPEDLDAFIADRTTPGTVTDSVAS